MMDFNKFHESVLSDKYKYLIGKTIRIDEMDGEPDYTGKKGVVEYVDDMGQLHGTWGGLAVLPGVDNFKVIKNEKKSRRQENPEKKRITESQGSIKEVELACGPGKIMVQCYNEYEGDWNEERSYYEQDFAGSIEEMARKPEWDEDLSKYCDNKGLVSLTFKEMKEIDNHFYMIWNCIYDEDLISLDEVKDYLSGQLSDGWGEGFEQHTIGEDREREQREFEEEDEDRNVETYWDTVETAYYYYYKPWCGKGFEIKELN